MVLSGEGGRRCVHPGSRPERVKASDQSDHRLFERLNMLPRIYFIRHGETEWSLSGQYTSRTDLPLTAHGEDLARELGLHLREISFARELVLTSPRQRARRTCGDSRRDAPN